MSDHKCKDYCTTADGVEFWCSRCGEPIAGPNADPFCDAYQPEEKQATNHWVTVFCLYADNLQPYTTSMITHGKETVDVIKQRALRQCEEDNGMPCELLFAGICEGDMKNWI